MMGCSPFLLKLPDQKNHQRELNDELKLFAKNSLCQVIEKFRLNGDIVQGTPPVVLNNCARDAVDLCPVQIIRIGEL
jgi:ferredoxin